MLGMVHPQSTLSDEHMKKEQIPLAGAVHDFTCPITGKIICFSQSEQFELDLCVRIGS